MNEQIASIGTLGTLALAVIAFFITTRRGVRADKQERLRLAAEERKQAIEDAERPLREEVERQRARADVAERRCDETSRATELVVDQATSIWRERVADREHEISNLKEERDSLKDERDAVLRDRDYYRDLVAAARGVDLRKPEDHQ